MHFVWALHYNILMFLLLLMVHLQWTPAIIVIFPQLMMKIKRKKNGFENNQLILRKVVLWKWS